MVPGWQKDRLFEYTRSGAWEVFITELATPAVTQLTGIEDKEDFTAPDWSPDGTQVTCERFISIKTGISPKTIYVMSADGQHQCRVLPDPSLNGPPTFRCFPRWAAYGHRILFYESKWLRDGDVLHLIVQRIGGGKHKITDITDRLGNNFLIAGASWMEQDRAILFSLKFLDKPTPNYNLYRYGLETGSLRRLTRATSDEEWPDWREGALSVSPHGKVTTLWGEIKQPEP